MRRKKSFQSIWIRSVWPTISLSIMNKQIPCNSYHFGLLPLGRRNRIASDYHFLSTPLQSLFRCPTKIINYSWVSFKNKLPTLMKTNYIPTFWPWKLNILRVHTHYSLITGRFFWNLFHKIWLQWILKVLWWRAFKKFVPGWTKGDYLGILYGWDKMKPESDEWIIIFIWVK